MGLSNLLATYSMAQMALMSHVSYLKYLDEEDRWKKDHPEDGGGKRDQGVRSRIPESKILNRDDKNNAQAFALIAGGVLG